MAFGGVLATTSLLRAVRVVEGGGGDVGGFGCAWRCPGGGGAIGGKIGDRVTRERGAPLVGIGDRTTCGRTSGVGVVEVRLPTKASSMASVTHSFAGTRINSFEGKKTARRARSSPGTLADRRERKTDFLRSVTAFVALIGSSCARRDSGNAFWRTAVNSFHGIRVDPR